MRRYVRKRSDLRFCDAKPSESVIVGSRHGGVGHTPRYPKLSDVAGARWGQLKAISTSGVMKERTLPSA